MKAYFSSKANDFNQQTRFHQHEATFYAWARGIAFVVLLILVFSFFQTMVWILALLAMGVFIAFVTFVIRSQFHARQAAFFQVQEVLVGEELLRLQLKLTGLDGGERFAKPDHPYAQDLDIFGDHSVYQLVNRASFPESQGLLADWLSHLPEKEEWLLRQQAAQELAGKPDWMMHFLATIRWTLADRKDKRITVTANDLKAWASRTTVYPVRTMWGVGLGLGMAAMLIGLLVAMGMVVYQWLYAVLLVNGVFLAITSRYLAAIHKGLDRAQYLLKSYQQALAQLEQNAWTSARLKSLQTMLVEKGARGAIDDLARLVNRMDTRGNMLYWLLNLPALLDVHLLNGLYRWKIQYGRNGLRWIEAIHEVEALVSVGMFAYAHPTYCLPEWAQRDFVFEGVALGHPLIDEKQRVCNHYSLQGKGHIDILTGSNMSGKSTFQRTLGVNLVLAYLGAPVCAERMIFSGMQIFTSMRTHDNLEANASSFYAELRRIQMLLRRVSMGDQVFFLLDEILKGTNSDDRHMGSLALARKLGTHPAMGIVSTHDLSLGTEAASLPNVRNFSFNSTLANGKLVFDYRLAPGMCRSFNATLLMKEMGILDE